MVVPIAIGFISATLVSKDVLATNSRMNICFSHILFQLFHEADVQSTIIKLAFPNHRMVYLVKLIHQYPSDEG